MERYRDNAKWLMYFAPFRALSISAAYLTPFFQLHGLSLSQIFVLQSIFSAAFLLWELPSGYLADRLGRARSIKVSAPIAGVAMIAYGLSTQFWQFVIWELLLALASGLISGVDTALLIDSLKAARREKDFVRLSQRINAFGFAATAFGVLVALAVARFWGISATLVADGLLTLAGTYIAWQLREAPQYEASEEEKRTSVWHAAAELASNPEARWLTMLGTVLATATYLAFWLSAPYYERMGIPVALLSVILAVRSLWKAWLSEHVKQHAHLERNLIAYAVLAGVVYLAMASQRLWLVWVVLGHDVVQALQTQPLTARLNRHMAYRHRATLNSLVNLVQRLAYTVAGPLAGLLVDRTGLSTGFIVIGVSSSLLAFVALAYLHRLGTLRT